MLGADRRHAAGDVERLDPLEFVRTIAVARIALPTSVVRLSAGRATMPEPVQALCFLAGANSIFYGDRLLTTGNPSTDSDRALFERLGLHPTDRTLSRTGRALVLRNRGSSKWKTFPGTTCPIRSAK